MTQPITPKSDKSLRETLEATQKGSREEGAYLHQLGIVAQNRGDYEAALDWYRKSLAIEEQLGNRAGMASFYHQLGRVAQDRGDYDAALDWYRKSLAIKEQLGDRAGIASTASNMGALYTETGSAANAVPLNLSSWALRLEMQSPDIDKDLYWLSKQQATLGAESFCALVARNIDTEGLQAILELLDNFEAARKQTEDNHPLL